MLNLQATQNRREILRACYPALVRHVRVLGGVLRFHKKGGMMSNEQKMLWLTLIAVAVAISTVAYMRYRDWQVDTRNRWIEIHRAMINLRAQREFVLKERSQMGAYSTSSPNLFEERQRDYALATEQLRAQLDRLNDDPLLATIDKFLEDHKDMNQWETDDYERRSTRLRIK
jgi:hypothetical protein